MSTSSPSRGRPTLDQIPAGSQGWVLLAPDAIPEAWQARGIPLVLVPLLPGELSDVTTHARATPPLDADNLALLRLAMAGLSVGRMARELSVSRRTIERRLTRLRERFGVDTTAQLVARAHERGW